MITPLFYPVINYMWLFVIIIYNNYWLCVITDESVIKADYDYWLWLPNPCPHYINHTLYHCDFCTALVSLCDVTTKAALIAATAPSLKTGYIKHY